MQIRVVLPWRKFYASSRILRLHVAHQGLHERSGRSNTKAAYFLAFSELAGAYNFLFGSLGCDERQALGWA